MAASDRSDPVLGALDGIVPDLEGFYKDTLKSGVRRGACYRTLRRAR